MDKHRRFKAVKIALMRSEEFGLLRGVMMLGTTVLGDVLTGVTSGTTPTSCSTGKNPTRVQALSLCMKTYTRLAGI